MINTLSLAEQYNLIIFGVGFMCVLIINLIKWNNDKAIARNFYREGQESPSLTSNVLVSILVAAWNEEEHVENHIESFIDLTYQSKELVLCAGGTDNTYQISKGFESENIKILKQNPGEGKQKALLRCFEKARGGVIFLTDADCFLDDASFEETVGPIIFEDENAVTGSSLPTTEQMQNVFIASQAVSQLYSNLKSGIYLEGLLGRNCAIRSSVLEKTQALKNHAPTGTDYVLAKTLISKGYKIRNVPHSLIRSNYHKKITKYIHQQWRWAKNVYFQGKQFSEKREVSKVLFNAIVGVLMLLLPISFVLGINFVIVLWTLLFLHGLFSRWRYIVAVKREFGIPMPVGILFFQPVMLFIDFIAWASLIPNTIFNTGKERW